MARKKEGEDERPSQGLLGAFADLIPGLGKLVERLEENPEFRQRFEEAELGMRKNLQRPEAYKKGVMDFHFSVRPLGSGIRHGGAWTPRKHRQLLRTPTEHEKTEGPVLEVIKEKNFLRVVGHWPRLKGEIKVEVRGKKLVLSIGDEMKEIALPFNAKVSKKTYKNGVLEIILRIEKRGKKRK